MQLTDKDGNIFGTGGLEITTSTGKPKIPVINTDITIGTTTIVGGVAGRLLFDDAGVVGETNGAFWDKVNSRFGIGTATPLFPLDVLGTAKFASATSGIIIRDWTAFNTYRAIYKSSETPSDTNYLLALDQDVLINSRGSGTDIRFNGAIRARFGNAFSLRVIGSGTTTATVGFEAANSSSTPLLQVRDNGNVLIGTTTDAGYKLDVAGSIRTQSSLLIANPAFTLGGSITHSANATLVIAGGPGGGENITIGPSNRIFINAQQSRFSNGSVQIASTLSVGVANTTAATMLWTTGGITASSALARGIGLDTTLVAAANNDVLVGLDVQPTFTNGAFTGVTNIAARIGGNVLLTQGPKTISIAAPSTSGSGGELTIAAGNATTAGTGGNISLQPGNGAGGPGAGTVIISNTSWWNGATVNGRLTVTNSGPNTGTSLQVNAGGQNGLSISWDNLTPFMQYGLVSARQSRFVNSSSYTFDNNLLIGTNTNAGYKLDVNGSARVVGSFIASAAIGAGSGSFALGTLATAASSTHGGALGYDAQSLNTHALAFGYSSRANGHSSVAIGRLAIANAADSVAFHNATSAGINSAAFGNGSTTTGTSSMATGSNAYTYLTGQLAVSGGSLNYKGDSQYSIYTGNLNTGIVNSGGTYSFAGIRPSNSTFGSDVTQIWYVECIVVFAVKGRTTAITEFALRDTYSIKYKLAVKSTNSLGTTILGTPVADSSFSDASMATTSVTFTIVSNNLVVNVTPPTWTSGGQMQFRGTASFGITELGVYGQPF